MSHGAMHTHLNRVQTFLAIVDLGSFTKAASYLNISRAMAAGTSLQVSVGLTRCCSRFSTNGDTNLETSPPKVAISRTNVPETNWY